MRSLVIARLQIIVLMCGLSLGANAEELTGRGEWRSLSGDAIRGSWTTNLTNTDGELSGTIELSGSNVLATAPVSGKLDGSNIVLGFVIGDGDDVEFTGLVTEGAVAGEWSCAMLGDEGVWTGSFRSQ